MTDTKAKSSIWLLAPLFGVLLYILLYFIAAQFYPGGSQLDKNSIGFSWKQNYWCNLLNEHAINGQPNPARPVALAAMVVLCLTLMIFWYIFPLYIQMKKGARLAVQVSGVAAMATGMFLFTPLHDLVINVATVFGLVALTGTFTGLSKLRWIKLLWMGLFNILLIALNNLFYYGNGLLTYLPVVQKITFLYFLVWICLIDIRLYRMERRVRTAASC